MNPKRGFPGNKILKQIAHSPTNRQTEPAF